MEEERDDSDGDDEISPTQAEKNRKLARLKRRRRRRTDEDLSEG